MEDRVKISLIIPVCNVEAFLRQCLDSVLRQKRRDFEAICVDDGSTDGSSAILAEYAARDGRIKTVACANSGAVVARQIAVASATGEWCLFLDPDDWLEPDALERLADAAGNTAADIVQFGFFIEETRPRPAADRARTEAYFNRPAGIFPAGDLFEAIYLKRRLAWNLIGRMVRAEVCKAAFAEQAKVYSIHETDVYATYHIIAHARLLEVVPDRLYHYRHGVGISTKRELTLGEYERTLGKFDTYDELATFAAGRYPEESPQRKAARAAGWMMALNSLVSLRRLKSAPERTAGFGMLREKCGAERLATLLADAFGEPPYPLAAELDSLGVLRERIVPKAVHTVGVDSPHLAAHGTGRAARREAAALLAHGERVVLFTDDGAPVDDGIPDGAEVVRLPPMDGAGAAPSARIKAMCDALRKHRVDVLHSYRSRTNRVIRDVVACKLVCGIPFYLQYHGPRTASIRTQPAIHMYVNEPRWLRSCDGVFAPRTADASVFAAEGARAFVAPRPDGGLAAELAAVFGGGGTPAALPDGETVSLYLERQRRALAELHRRRTMQINAIAKERDAVAKERDTAAKERDAAAARAKGLDARVAELSLALDKCRSRLKAAEGGRILKFVRRLLGESLQEESTQ